MLRNLVIFGLCAGVSAAGSLLYANSREGAQSPAQAIEASGRQPGPVLSTPVRPASVAPSGRKAQIQADANGHFLADFRLNGRRVAAMVDTGATLVALNRSTARGLGVALALGDFTYTVDTANGTARAAVVTLRSVELGRIRVNDVEAMVLEDRALSGTLIGMSFLKRLDRYGVESGTLLLAQ